MATTTTTTTVTTPPQEMPGNDPPPMYSPQTSPPAPENQLAQAPRALEPGTTNTEQEITTAPNTTTTTETRAAPDTEKPLPTTEVPTPNEKGQQPGLVQPMGPNGNPDPAATQDPVPLEKLRDLPGVIDCPICNKRGLTFTNLESGNTVAGWAVALCCVTGICCAWIPCVMDSCKDTIHSCSQCRNRVVTITNSGRVNVHATPQVPAKARAA